MVRNAEKCIRVAGRFNVLLFGVVSLQMLLVPPITGLIALEFFPLAGIFGLFAALWLVATKYFGSPPGKMVFLLASVLTVFLCFYWLTLFSGIFQRLLQVVLILTLGTNISALGCALGVPLMAVIRHTASWGPGDFGSTSRARAASVACLLTALTFTPLAVFDFGRVYRVQASPGATTRTSFWGAPHRNDIIITRMITPIDNWTLRVENTSLDSPAEMLRPGGLLYVVRVTHPSNASVNYCDYRAGARSYPNGTVQLAQALPTTSGVAIEFSYLLNVEVYEHLQQLGSRIIHDGCGGNESFIEHPDLFWNIGNTYEYLLLEHWNISYFVNIHVAGFGFLNVFNHRNHTARAHQFLDFIEASDPQMSHCVGLAFDLEPKPVVEPEFNPDRPEFGQYSPNPFVSEEKWVRLNEQNTEILADAREAYFGVFDRAAEIGRGAYLTFVYYAMEDLATDGDLGYTRLPVWRHPNAEYGVMSYQSKDPPEEAAWDIYQMNRNQQRVYGSQGRSLLTGWLTNDEDVHLKYYTNDQAGLDRYLRDIQLHQACGAEELFHAPLYDLMLKWGDDVILEFDRVLNEAPKEEFTFRAHPWGRLDTTHYDIVENFNNLWLGVPVLLVGLGVLLSAWLRRSQPM